MAAKNSTLTIRQQLAGLFGISADAVLFLGEEVRHGIAQAGVTEVVPGVGNDGFKAADQLVFALGTGVEALQASGDGMVHPLVETGLEMQPVKLRQTTPVTPVQAVAADQAKGHSHRSTCLMGEHYADHLGHALSQQAEEGARQVR